MLLLEFKNAKQRTQMLLLEMLLAWKFRRVCAVVLSAKGSIFRLENCGISYGLV